MNSVLRILYLSDSRSGGHLVQGKLAEEGVMCDLRRVETRADFQAALGQGQYDLLLADYALPAFDIYSLLAISREKRLDVPFILLAETLGDELAIEILKAGATDVVLKQRPARLVAAVRRALRDAENWRVRRWELEELRSERDRFALTLEVLGEGVLTTDLEGNIASINRIAEALTGWTSEEAAGMPLARVVPLLHERTRQPCEDPVAKVLATGGSGGLLTHAVLVAKDGTERLIAHAGATIRDRAVHVLGVVLSFHEEPDRAMRAPEPSPEKKLEALRALAGGIANDFNDVITTLAGHTAMAKLSTTGSDERLLRLVGESEKASIQAKRLIWRIETFARGQEPDEKMTSVADLVLIGKERRRERAEKKLSISDLLPMGLARERKRERPDAGGENGESPAPLLQPKPEMHAPGV